MTEHLPFALNVNPDGQNVLHRHPSYESCNWDDTKGGVYLDDASATEVVLAGSARRCEHCFPNDDPATAT